MTPDQFNGFFESAGALMIWVSIVRTLRDRMVRGVSVWTTAFFTAWGYWNLYFYAHLDQLWSLAGAILMVLSNTSWVILLVFYRWREYQYLREFRDERTLAQFDA